MVWVLIAFLIFILFLWTRTSLKIFSDTFNDTQKKQVLLESNIDQLKSTLDKIPSKVLESITSSGNNYKGRLAELIGYINLNAQYDKVIPFGNVTDFIGIRFPSDDQDGTVDFIDIKNGPNARLTKDQVKLKKILDQKKVNFVKVRVDTKVLHSKTE